MASGLCEWGSLYRQSVSVLDTHFYNNLIIIQFLLVIFATCVCSTRINLECRCHPSSPSIMYTRRLERGLRRFQNLFLFCFVLFTLLHLKPSSNPINVLHSSVNVQIQLINGNKIVSFGEMFRISQKTPIVGESSDILKLICSEPYVLENN